MKINLVDVKAQNSTIKKELDAAISDVIESSFFVDALLLMLLKKSLQNIMNHDFVLLLIQGQQLSM